MCYGGDTGLSGTGAQRFSKDTAGAAEKGRLLRHLLLMPWAGCGLGGPHLPTTALAVVGIAVAHRLLDSRAAGEQGMRETAYS